LRPWVIPIVYEWRERIGREGKAREVLQAWKGKNASVWNVFSEIFLLQVFAALNGSTKNR
jgi:hypothetical protein